jgi:hypothetical protein
VSLSLYRWGLLVVVLAQVATLCGQQPTLPTPAPEPVTFVDVYQVWWTVKGQLVFYSEAPTKAKAVEVAAALALFPEKPRTEVRGPFKGTIKGPPCFPIVFVRETLKDNLITGKVSAQGWDLGAFYENDKLRIPPGIYSATLVFKHERGIVLGPDGQLGTSGDFAIQLTNVKGRPDIFLASGDKAEQSNGSPLLGAPVKTPGGALIAPEGLKTMRLLFYEQNNRPMLTPNKTITVEIRDTIVREKKQGD